jgi:hypothetical protein
MKTAMIVGILALAGLSAREGQGAEKSDYRVRVYLQGQQVTNPTMLFRAEAMATGMFAGIGVQVRWEIGSPRPTRGDKKAGIPQNRGLDIVLRLASGERENDHGEALGYALPYAQSGVRVTLFYDRILGPVVGNEGAATVLLAHALAHEITHVLQGVVRHSEEGLMKAQWTPADRAQMKQKPLPFTAYDVELIQRAMAAAKVQSQIAAR